ncbi:CoA-binding protein [Bacteriovorax sp. Seq25_V]|uniref:CoA-binding protein n=1 Tax=Bacteriovorax sp. Seq25_V TaxID=1201288 RepID=UPI000389E8AF|nr:CoA-binding protein [Bacteriovorax sp. Seq25_V]EQC45421.1 CoA-binding domain protein [Bacteriovorax sp. Seq25_V]
MKSEKVLILGASDNQERYSYKALHMLEDHGHQPILVNPIKDEIEGRKVFHSIEEVQEKIDTLTVYVNNKISSELTQSIIKLKPTRVIFNPGSENEELAKSLSKLGINCENACTLVLLTTNQF